ncbi:hypothetical protein G7Y89_g7789 [Cudoniella acicularis]|uniref:PAS domain-containing protein n=1 Tax=Cudoniella acicularis TaxID=354080 RepID=A0A8H4RIM8_9HELO|nr:hypothetical protein G7Y89_g7789 [Cudoniella acicularis]
MDGFREDYQQQAQRLSDLRSSAEKQQQGSTRRSGNDSSVRDGERTGTASAGSSHDGEGGDPLMYPGLYSPSGFDMMDILVRVRTRPNPRYELGSIDDSVALILCDAESHDIPIVYCSEHFELLTGYNRPEILGRNCRFLQDPFQLDSLSHVLPDNSVIKHTEVKAINDKAKRELKEKIVKGEEAQVKLINFRKDGKIFFNVLTVIPILWKERGDGDEVRGKLYMVGFQADEQKAFFKLGV